MTKKGLRQQARKILNGAQENPNLAGGHTLKEYRKFWEGKRIGICELLGINNRLRSERFPFPWEGRK